MAPTVPLTGTAHDPVRTYSAPEEQRLSENLFAIASSIREGKYAREPIGVALLSRLHQRLFEGVRSHAGAHRDRGFGQEYLVFGPNRSVHRDEVRMKLMESLEHTRKMVRSCEDNPEDPAYERAAFHVAVWIHAEVVRVHPFEDGNGRASRALMNVVLHRLRLRPVTVMALKQEYTAALNHYFAGGDLAPLIDLLLTAPKG